MPRFENEGFNPAKRNRNEQADRTVPADENYYNYSPIDLNFNNKQRDDIISDNQKKSNGINPCDNFNIQNPKQPDPPQRFVSERAQDYYQQPQRQNRDTYFDTGNSAQRVDKKRDKPKKQKNKDNKHGKKPLGKLPLRKRILLIILALVIAIVGSVAVVLGRINYKEHKENEALALSSSTLESSALVKNILLLGVDARSGESGDETRSDTMMLVSLDMKHHSIKMTSFLRDTWVYVPSLGYEQRLNAACSSGGYQGVVDAIEYNFGIDIDGYAVVDFEMFKVLIDSLGGVEVDVTEAEANEVTNHPYRYDHVTLESGKYKLTGEQALAYCRIRKIDTDFVRTQRQRTVMSAILDGAKHSGPFKLYRMAFKSAPYIETDLTKGQLLRFVADAGICITGDMHQQKVPFEGTWEYANIQGNSVITINTEKNKEMLIDYIYKQSSDEINAQESSSDNG